MFRQVGPFLFCFFYAFLLQQFVYLLNRLLMSFEFWSSSTTFFFVLFYILRLRFRSSCDASNIYTCIRNNWFVFSNMHLNLLMKIGRHFMFCFKLCSSVMRACGVYFPLSLSLFINIVVFVAVARDVASLHQRGRHPAAGVGVNGLSTCAFFWSMLL